MSMDTNLPTVLNDLFMEIINKTEPEQEIPDNNPFTTSVYFKCTLMNKYDPEFQYELYQIDSVTVTRDFVSSFMDEITLQATIPPVDLLTILDKFRGLQMEFVMKYYDPFKKEVDNDRQIIKTFDVFIQNKDDILKQINIKQIIHTTDDTEDEIPRMEQHVVNFLPIKFQLLEHDSYNIHKTFTSTVLTEITPGDAIKYLASKFKITKINMVPPDNERTITHLIIPPQQGSFSTIFPYIHHKYGVYTHGFGFYYTNSILYTYPTSNFNLPLTESPKMLKIVKLPYDIKYAHITTPYKFSEDYTTLSVLSAQLETTLNVRELVAENTGTNAFYHDADRGVDFIRNQDPKNIILPTENVRLMDVESTGTINRDKMVPVYKKPTSNPYLVSSELNENLCEWVTVQIPSLPVWSQEDQNPFVLTKGHQVEISRLEGQNVITTIKGLIDQVYYTFTKTIGHMNDVENDSDISVTPHKNVFTVYATLIIRTEVGDPMYKSPIKFSDID